MTSVPHLRRTVSELLTLYLVEPSIRHVFTEGRMDRALLSHFVRAGDFAASVHRLDDYVDVSELLANPQEETGVKARILLLAEAFGRWPASKERPRSLTCIVDRDSGTTVNSHVVLVTDYSDIELYTWESSRIAKLLELGYGIDVTGGIVSDLMRFVEERAIPLCACRRVVHERGEGARPPTNITRYACPRRGGIDLIGFIRGYGGDITREALSIAEEVQRRIAAAGSEDARLHMNGHDVILIAAVAIHRIAGRTTVVPELERAWFSCLEWQDLLKSEPMFMALARRLSA